MCAICLCLGSKYSRVNQIESTLLRSNSSSIHLSSKSLVERQSKSRIFLIFAISPSNSMVALRELSLTHERSLEGRNLRTLIQIASRDRSPISVKPARPAVNQLATLTTIEATIKASNLCLFLVARQGRFELPR